MFHKFETGVGKSEIEIIGFGRLAYRNSLPKWGFTSAMLRAEEGFEALQSIAEEGWENVKKTLEFNPR